MALLRLGLPRAACSLSRELVDFTRINGELLTL
jgi:hypothetical protein